MRDKALAMHCAVSSERNAETFRRFLYGSSGLRAVSRKRNCPGVCCVSNQERCINPSCPGAENAVSHCLRAGEYAVSSTGGVYARSRGYTLIYPEQVGIRIAEGRRRQGLTQNRVAARMGVTPQAVSKWERGLSCPDLVLLDELAELLDTSIDRLLTGRDGCRSIERPQEVFLPAGTGTAET